MTEYVTKEQVIDWFRPYGHDGSMSKCRAFATEKAMSNWANKQYNKDEWCTVYCTYHA